MFTSTEILGTAGRIAGRLKNYEHRPEQLAMAQAVEDAISRGTTFRARRKFPDTVRRMRPLA